MPWGRETDARILVEFARRAEALGFTSLWAGDTLLRPVIETFTMLSAAAAVTERVLTAYRRGAPPPSQVAGALVGLTAREVEVLRLIGRGASNAEIAESLVVSEGTVKTHIGSIFSKLELRDRAAAIVFAFDHGLVQPSQPA